jgi:hypothetical protein
MKAKNLATAIVAVPLLAMSSLVFAAEPVQLSDAQMDGVTAGGIADAQAFAIALGKTTATFTSAAALTQVVGTMTFELTKINNVGSSAISISTSSAL